MNDDSRRDSIKTQVDEAIDESFPASDPPSWMPKSTTRMNDDELSEAERKKLPNNRVEAEEKKAQEEVLWLKEKENIDRRKAEPGAVPSEMLDPAAAPLGTDQEAGPETSSPLDAGRQKRLDESRKNTNS